MTAKEHLRQVVDRLSEDEAADALRVIEGRTGRDALLEALENAPLDDEPETPEEQQAVREARDERGRGEGVPLEQVRRELLG